MTTETNTIPTLTKEEAKLLKSKDLTRVVLRQRPLDGASPWGPQEGIIDITLETKAHGAKVETRHTIKCRSIIYNYGRVLLKSDAVVFNYQESYMATWPSIAHHFSVGDKIMLI